MKNIAILIIVTALLAGCKKDKETLPATSGPGLNQKWELYHQYTQVSQDGLVVISDTTHYPAGDSWMEFRTDMRFFEYEDGTILDSGTYQLQGTLLSMYQDSNTIRFQLSLAPGHLQLYRDTTTLFGTYVMREQTTLKFNALGN
jgi:hypothetical protein